MPGTIDNDLQAQLAMCDKVITQEGDSCLKAAESGDRATTKRYLETIKRLFWQKRRLPELV